MPTILLIDDDIPTHDAGDFSHIMRDGPAFQRPLEAEARNEVFGLTGYFTRDLESLGVKILTATGIADALSRVKSPGEKLDLLILDVMMPYLDNGEFENKFSSQRTAGGLRTGFVLAEELHNIAPTVPIWILSQVAPITGSLVNKATSQDLISRGIVSRVVSKIDQSSTEFARDVLEFLKGLQRASDS